MIVMKKQGKERPFDFDTTVAGWQRESVLGDNRRELGVKKIVLG